MPLDPHIDVTGNAGGQIKEAEQDALTRVEALEPKVVSDIAAALSSVLSVLNPALAAIASYKDGVDITISITPKAAK